MVGTSSLPCTYVRHFNGVNLLAHTAQYCAGSVQSLKCHIVPNMVEAKTAMKEGLLF